MDAINRAFVRFELQQLSKEKGMKIPLWYKSRGSSLGPSQTYICGYCGLDFSEGDPLEYGEHYVQKHPGQYEKDLARRRVARQKLREARVRAQ